MPKVKQWKRQKNKKKKKKKKDRKEKCWFEFLRITVKETHSGNPEKSFPRKRKSQGLLKTKYHKVVKNCLVRIMTDSDVRQKIFFLEESQVVLG